MKKLLAILLLVVSPVSYSASSGSFVFASGFIDSIRNSTSLTQQSTGYNQACGPTSFLYVLNYHYYKRTGNTLWYTQSVNGARAAIQAAYRDMPEANLNEVTHTDWLKALGLKWNFYQSVKADGDNSFTFNRTNMINRLRNNQPVIVAIKAAYNDYNYDHIVIITHYNTATETFYYFDPYRGRFESESSLVMSQAVLGQLPYLALVPWR